MKVVYVAGPFRAANQWRIAENIRAAERVGRLVAMAGAMPLIPHANTAHFHGLETPEFWLEGTLELLRRCDAAVFIDNWHESRGSVGEWEECMRLKLPHMDVSSMSQAETVAAIIEMLDGMEAPFGEEDIAEEQRNAGRPAENPA